MLACYKIFTLHGLRSSPSKASKDQPTLTARQLQLLGLKPKAHQLASSKPSKKPPKSKPHSTPPSAPPRVPLHQFTTTSAKCSSPGSSNDRLNTSGEGGAKIRLVTSPSKSPSPPTSLYLFPGAVGVSSLASSQHHSPSLDSVVSTPWSDSMRTPSTKESASEEMLELFLAQVDEKITEPAGKLATPPPIISGLGIASPKNLPASANTSGTTRNTPLRSFRMSPGSQKFTTPPRTRRGRSSHTNVIGRSD